jgi:predicted NAD-dependent protein-ADP-ribosyltransferase YbiA (DUF1768 family)
MVKNMKVIDIGSTEDYISKKLSNFSEFSFVIDDVYCASMEGFLQSLKFSEIEKQKQICLLFGKKAKFKGKKKKWYIMQELYWKGEVIERESEKYQILLDKAFSALFKNKEYSILLMKTKKYKIVHSIGKENPKETVLTVFEFCDRLDKLRYYS